MEAFTPSDWATLRCGDATGDHGDATDVIPTTLTSLPGAIVPKSTTGRPVQVTNMRRTAHTSTRGIHQLADSTPDSWRKEAQGGTVTMTVDDALTT